MKRKFIIMCGLSQLQLEALKNASVLTITIENTDYPERQTGYLGKKRYPDCLFILISSTI